MASSASLSSVNAFFCFSVAPSLSSVNSSGSSCCSGLEAAGGCAIISPSSAAAAAAAGDVSIPARLDLETVPTGLVGDYEGFKQLLDEMLIDRYDALFPCNLRSVATRGTTCPTTCAMALFRSEIF